MNTQDPANEDQPSNDAELNEGTAVPQPAKSELAPPNAETRIDAEPAVAEPATERFDLIEPEMRESQEVHDPTTQVLITPTAEDVAKASAGQGYIDQDGAQDSAETTVLNTDSDENREWVATGSAAVGYAGMNQNAVTHYPETQPMVYSSEEQQMLAPSAPYYPAAPPAVAAQQPERYGNLVFSIVFSVVGTLLFAALYFIACWFLQGIGGMAFLGEIDSLAIIAYPTYYFPVLAFFIGNLIVGLAGSKLGWWFHVVSGYLVAAIVVLSLLFARMYEESTWDGTPLSWDPDVALSALTLALVAFIVAREVPVWMGAIVSARAKKQKQRRDNAQAEADSRQAELSARYATDQGIAYQGQEYAQGYAPQHQYGSQSQGGYYPQDQPPYPTA